MSTVKTNTTERVTKLREFMKSPNYNVQAYIIPSEDAHQSEYTPSSEKRRDYITGFTGSAGVAVVTLQEAALWTDGRYFLQAERQLDQNWKLMKQGATGTPTLTQWLKDVLPKSSRVGVDPRLISVGTAQRHRKDLSGTLELVSVFDNLVDKVWSERPQPSLAEVVLHPVEYAGVSHVQKLENARKLLTEKKADALVVAALDEIAWLYNLRGYDVEYNPVFISYALVTQTEASLYIDSRKVGTAVKQHLDDARVVVKPYEKIFEDLKQLSDQDKVVWMDVDKCSLALFDSVKESLIFQERSPITFPKALKNPVELAGLRNSHIRDAAALVQFFCWLEERVNAGDDTLTECTIADKLEDFRRQQKDFVSLSFDTISGSGPNGAIIHYKPDPASAAKIVKDQLYLCDSGAQYRDGTTDVTRTMHFGEPTAYQKHCFTRVLQGHIALGSAVFPKGTNGYQLDTLARTPLWSSGLDYRHGTGHGVGAFLNVHEGPQGISGYPRAQAVAFAEGMTITNEPGYYEDGQFGIRIENVCVVVKANPPHNFGNQEWFTLDSITLVPIQTKMMDTSLMTQKEMDWVDAYHKQVLDKVGPHLQGAPLEWLKRETAPLRRQ